MITMRIQMTEVGVHHAARTEIVIETAEIAMMTIETTITAQAKAEEMTAIAAQTEEMTTTDPATGTETTEMTATDTVETDGVTDLDAGTMTMTVTKMIDEAAEATSTVEMTGVIAAADATAVPRPRK